MNRPNNLPSKQSTDLRPALGVVHLTMIGIGSIIGAGIFVITGTATAEHAGPAVILSFVIAGLGCLFCGLCYAEFASVLPESGSSYTYSYATMGRAMAWFIGWNMVLEYLVASSTVAVGWSGYFASLLKSFNIFVPYALSVAPIAGDGFGTLHLTGAIMNLPATALVAILSMVLALGVRESALLNAVMVFVKTGIVVLVVTLGLPHVNAANFTPFILPNTGNWGHFGVSGILAASGMIFFAYIGFEVVSIAAQEAKNPKRDLPIGILSSLFICTVLYMGMAVVLIGITDWRTLNVPNPVSFAAEANISLAWLAMPVNIGALVGLASVAFVSLFGQSRLFYAMARDRFLPPIFCAVHPRLRTPHHSIMITGVCAAVIAAVCPLGILADLVSIGTLLAFAAVCVGILILRKTSPDLHRPFHTPFVWLVAPAGVLSCGLMMLSLSNATWIRLVLWTALGSIIYLAYGYKRAQPFQWRTRGNALNLADPSAWQDIGEAVELL